MIVCATRPAEWWETGDEGNRLAMLLCGVCPMRRGEECRAGRPDPNPHGVIRAGVAYSDSGNRLPVCVCGYPMVGYGGGAATRCARCVPRVSSWLDRQPPGRAAVDEAVVERMLAGDPPDYVRPVDRREALRRLWLAGLTNREAALRLGMNIKAVRRTRQRMRERAA